MLKYWPNIEYRENGTINHLSTTDPYNYPEEAVRQVNFWMKEYGFDIVKASVQTFCDGQLRRTTALQVVCDSWGKTLRWQLPVNTVKAPRSRRVVQVG